LSWRDKLGDSALPSNHRFEGRDGSVRRAGRACIRPQRWSDGRSLARFIAAATIANMCNVDIGTHQAHG
jgi:hypothetical protein